MDLTTSRNALASTEHFTVALIATYPEMSKRLSELLHGTNIELMDIYASFEKAAAVAKELENQVDIILTRGGTGHYIKQAASIPVISIPITPFDLMLSVSKLPPEIERVAFINYQRAIFGTNQIEKMFHKRIFQYQFTNNEELRQTAAQAKADGCQVFIGGAEGVSYARNLGLNGIEIVSGQEAVFQAMTEAVEIIRVKREEQKQSARLQRAFDTLAEGICIADEQGKIKIFNPAAAHIFRVEADQVIGKNLRETPIGKLTQQAFDHREAHENQLEQVYGMTLNTNHVPIYRKSDFVGLVCTYQDVTKIQQLEGQIRSKLSQKGFKARYTFDDILTDNPGLRRAKKLAALYARTDSAVLIEGESGTGKELFAHSIHNASVRASGPFVTVNCAAIPEQLLESELFGYAPGAFTGARKEGKQGLFELAHNGTIFLDEIGEMPKYLQARLLRVLQEKEIMRVGDNKIISVNCRIISATNKDLGAMVRRAEFREDLYYRLSIFTVTIPPLRERPEDVPLLSRYFLDALHLPLDEKKRGRLETYLKRLHGYRWPGNVRELASVCARLALPCTSPADEDLESHLKESLDGYVLPAGDQITLYIGAELPLRSALGEAERQYINAILERNEGNQSAAAKQLGIGRTTLWRRLTGPKEGDEG